MSLFMQASLNPSLEDKDFLTRGLCQEAARKKGMRPIQPYGFFLKNSRDQTVGGICGFSYYGCLSIDDLCIQAPYRGQGWGRKLVEAAESFGRDEKCTLFTVNTMDWEARGFYEKLGYSVEFARKGYEGNSTLYFLRKG